MLVITVSKFITNVVLYLWPMARIAIVCTAAIRGLSTLLFVAVFVLKSIIGFIFLPVFLDVFVVIASRTHFVR